MLARSATRAAFTLRRASHRFFSEEIKVSQYLLPSPESNEGKYDHELHQDAAEYIRSQGATPSSREDGEFYDHLIFQKTVGDTKRTGVIKIPVTEEEAMGNITELALCNQMLHEYPEFIQKKYFREPEEGTFAEAFGLGPFHRKASMAVLLSIYCISEEHYVFNDESAVTFVLLYGLTHIYVMTRGGALDYYNEWRDAQVKFLRDAEEVQMAALRVAISSFDADGSQKDAYLRISAETLAVEKAETVATQIAEKNTVADLFRKKLAQASNHKRLASKKVYKQLCEEINAAVSVTTATDDFRKLSLEHILDCLAVDGAGGADGAGYACPVDGLYQDLFKEAGHPLPGKEEFDDEEFDDEEEEEEE